MARFNHEKTYRNRVNKQYQRIAQIIQATIARHTTPTGQIDDPIALMRELEAYGEKLGPWAEAFWGQILSQQHKLLARDWKAAGVRLPEQTPAVQAAIAQAQAEQVHLIKTLPRTAGEKAQEMAEKAALSSGERASTLIAQLQGLEPGYPEYAARRLARTEIAKSQSLLVTAQAKEAGATHYVWCTVGDEATRPEHAELNGKIFRFDDLSDKDGKGCPAPGQIFNCRCYARPLLPEEVLKAGKDDD